MIKETKITLGEMDAALIIRANGSTEMFIPDHKADDIVPDTTLALMWLAFQTEGEGTIKELADCFKVFAREYGIGSSLQ